MEGRLHGGQAMAELKTVDLRLLSEKEALKILQESLGLTEMDAREFLTILFHAEELEGDEEVV